MKTSKRIGTKVFTKTIVLVFLIFITTSFGLAESELDILEPEEDYNYDFEEDLVIEWESTQDHQENADLEESEIRIQGGEQVDREITRDENLDRGETVTYTESFSPNELEDLDEGTWTIEVSDLWSDEEMDDGHGAYDTVFIDAGVHGDVSTEIQDPEEESIYGRDGLEIEWAAQNDYNTDLEIEETDIHIEDSEGNNFQETITQGTEVEEGGETLLTESVSSSDLEDLEDGEWDLTIEDNWEEDDQSEDEVSFEAIDERIEIEFQEPEENKEITQEDELYVYWHSTTYYSEEETHQDSELTLEDESGNSISESINVGESGSDGFTSPVSYEFEEGELEGLEGTTEITVTDNWDVETEEKLRTIEVESVDDTEDGDDAVPEGDGVIEIESPDGTYDKDDGLEVEWDSISDYNDDVELVRSELELQGDSGRTTSQEKTIGEVISEGDLRTSTITFDSSDYGAFDEGEWTVTVEDEWDFESNQESQTFTVESADDDSDEDTGEDDETDDDSDEDDSDDSEEEETDEDESDDSDDEDTDETDDEDTSEEDEDIADDESEDESEEDTEDSDDDVEDDESEGVDSDNETVGDETDVSDGEDLQDVEQGLDDSSQGVVSESLDALAESSPMFWLALAALFGVFMFWRSDYKLDL